MSDTPLEDTDAFLLTLDETGFIGVGALLALRARPTTKDDVRLVDAYLEVESPIKKHKSKLLVTSPPKGLLPQ